MSRWKITRVSEMANIISGGTPKTEISEYWNGDIPWLSVKDFSGNTRHVYSSEKSITELGLNNSATQLLFPGDIIISARGTVGEIAQVGKTMAFNQSCYGLRAKDGYLADFLYYVLKYQIKHLKAVANGAVFDTIILKTFDKMKCNVPPFSVQTRIADILSSYDDLIENNNRRIQLLEQTAQELYREWFVRFRFPGHEKVKFENGLPEGWEIVKLGNYCNIITGKKDANEASGYGKYPFFTCAKETTLNTNEYILDEKAILISGNGSYTGFVKKYSGKFDLYQRTYALYNFKKSHWLYFYNVMKLDFEYRYMGGTNGSAIPYITKPILLNFKLILPTSNILERASKIWESLENRIKNLSITNRNLTAQRDLLLPRLMSGKMEVSE